METIFCLTDKQKFETKFVSYKIFATFLASFLSLGVSICLDVISIEISISTPKKYQSRRSRKSRQFQKVSLD